MEDNKPTHVLLTPEQVEQYKKFFPQSNESFRCGWGESFKSDPIT